MYLRISKFDGSVKLTAPLNLPKKDIINFINSKIDWIRKNKVNAVSYQYLNGEKHYLWGKKYKLQLIHKNKTYKNVFNDEENIYLPTSKNTTFKQREKAMVEWYRTQLKLAIPDILDKCVAIVGKKPNEWRVKNMKTRWGSCNVNQKRIWLNLQLAKKPISCLEYVITHEIVHFYVSNHGSEFKGYMDEFYPNWRDVKNLLNSSTLD